MIDYTATGIVISDDTDNTRPPLVLPPGSTQAEVEAAATSYLPAPPPAPRWLDFLAAVEAAPGVGSAIGEGLSRMVQPSPDPAHNPFAAFKLGVGLGQAAESGNPQVFLAGWAQASAAGIVTPDIIQAVQALAIAHDLPEAFVSGLTTTGN